MHNDKLTNLVLKGIIKHISIVDKISQEEIKKFFKEEGFDPRHPMVRPNYVEKKHLKEIFVYNFIIRNLRKIISFLLKSIIRKKDTSRKFNDNNDFNIIINFIKLFNCNQNDLNDARRVSMDLNLLVSNDEQ